MMLIASNVWASSCNDEISDQYIKHKHHTSAQQSHPVKKQTPPKNLLAPTQREEGRFAANCEPGGKPCQERPCDHNDWDDVRTRKGKKILRCKLCSRKWKLDPTIPGAERCSVFITNGGNCPNGLQCSQLHVHKKKSHADEVNISTFMPEPSPPMECVITMTDLKVNLSKFNEVVQVVSPQSSTNKSDLRSMLTKLADGTSEITSITYYDSAKGALSDDSNDKDEVLDVTEDAWQLMSHVSEECVIRGDHEDMYAALLDVPASPEAPLPVSAVPGGSLASRRKTNLGVSVGPAGVASSYSPTERTRRLITGLSQTASIAFVISPKGGPRGGRAGFESTPPSLIQTPTSCKALGAPHAVYLPAAKHGPATPTDAYMASSPGSTCSSVGSHNKIQ